MTNGQGHTKGPWVLQDGYVVAGAWPLGVTICEPTMAHSGNRLTPDEALANGRLIAAAPDLLEALGNTLALLSAFATPDDQVMQATLKQARAALSRVSGEGR